MKKHLVDISLKLADITSRSKQKIRAFSKEFLQSGLTILVYSYSSVVADSLIHGAK
jgi:translation initiation factor 2B subunit (eIF-2B alpha/beta/delta family)